MSETTILVCDGCGVKDELRGDTRRGDCYTARFSMLPPGWVSASAQERVGNDVSAHRYVSGDFHSWDCFTKKVNEAVAA